MTSATTSPHSNLFNPDLPAAAPAPFKAFPRYNFVGGNNDQATVPVAQMADAAKSMVLAHGHTFATYHMQSGPQGFLPLREFITNQLSKSAGMTESTDNVLMTSGSLQALDLVNALLLSPGDVVIAEEASYSGAISRIRAAGAQCLPVRLDSDGIDTNHLAQLLEQEQRAGRRVKYIYTIPTVQNPTGSVMSQERRERLIALAQQYDCLIFEDDCYADLLWGADRPPAIRALGSNKETNRVIYCGSFSKSLAPALRVGYLIADWPVIAQLIAIKSDAGSGSLEQIMLAEFCEKHYASHLETLRPVLTEKCEAIMAALTTHFGSDAQFTAPKGGIFIWVRLPEHVDTTRLAQVVTFPPPR